jgi:hypothetical protein
VVSSHRREMDRMSAQTAVHCWGMSSELISWAEMRAVKEERRVRVEKSIFD